MVDEKQPVETKLAFSDKMYLDEKDDDLIPNIVELCGSKIGDMA